jgi:HSP20 family molecular chaperone IbpA
MRRGGEMFKDPQDMFRDMDEMFTYMYSQMTRDVSGRDHGFFVYPDILEGEGESSREPCLSHDELRTVSEPAVEVHRIDDEVKVITELAGITRDSIHLTMKGKKLFIDADTGTVKYHTSATLPPVDSDPMQISLKNGVLEVTFAVLTGIPDQEDR